MRYSITYDYSSVPSESRDRISDGEWPAAPQHEYACEKLLARVSISIKLLREVKVGGDKMIMCVHSNAEKNA